MTSADQVSADRVVIPGSEREPDREHQRVGDPDPDATLEVSVYLRAASPLDWVDAEAAQPPAQRRTLSRQDLSATYGAGADDIAAVRAFAAQYGLEVAEVDAARRHMLLRGRLGDFARAFEVQGLGAFAHPSAGVYRGRQGPLTVPAALAGVVTGVFGIDQRPQASPHLRRHVRSSAPTSYTPIEVARAYDFPPGLTGAGQTVAVIELGAASARRTSTPTSRGLAFRPRRSPQSESTAAAMRRAPTRTPTAR